MWDMRREGSMPRYHSQDMVYMDTWSSKLGEMSCGWSLKKKRRSHKILDLGDIKPRSSHALKKTCSP
jgi:hypothetical protein